MSVKAFTMVRSVWPQTSSWEPLVWQTWSQFVEDIPDDVLLAGTKRYVLQGKEWPNIAQLRKACYEVCDLLPPPFGMVVGLLKTVKNRRDLNEPPMWLHPVVCELDTFIEGDINGISFHRLTYQGLVDYWTHQFLNKTYTEAQQAIAIPRAQQESDIKEWHELGQKMAEASALEPEESQWKRLLSTPYLEGRREMYEAWLKERKPELVS